MQHASETGVRRLRGRMLVLTTASALVLSGCISPAFRESVGQFGAATKAAMTAQSERLGRVSNNERDEIRQDLAERRAEIVFDTTTCARLIQGQEGGPCLLRVRGGDPVATVARYENIAALGQALSAYGDSLVALAADSTEDQAKFASAVTAAGTSLSNLHDAIRKAGGAETNDLSGPIGAIAGLVGELGNLYFQHRRNAVLRRVIIAGEPAVHRAIGLLREAAIWAAQRERRLLGREAQQAGSQSRRVVNNPASSVADIRQAHSLFLDSVDAINRYDTQVRLFDALIEAHTRLVRAAQRGASTAELQAALESAIQLATTARNTITTIRQAGSTGNDN